MAGRWAEGWESHTNGTQLARKYATFTGSVTAQTGRVLPNAASIGATVLVTPSFPLHNTWGVGFALRINAQVSGLNSGAQGFYIERGGNEQFHIEIVSNAGSFEIRLMRAATQIAITTATYAYGVWHHFELKADALTAAATYELRHNEVAAFSGSGANLANSASNQADGFALRFSTTSTNVLLDDIMVWDGSGSVNNDFRGDSIIEAIEVSGAGNSTQWTPSAGSNFDNVDDPGSATPDDAGAGGFNSSDTNGQKDLYAYFDLTTIQGTVHWVQLGTQMAMAAAGSRIVKSKFRDDGGTEADGTSHTISSTSYDEFTESFDVNPQSAAAWDLSDINGGQFGVEVVS